jgi:ABC-type transport system substrate-binding protein
MKHDDKRKDTRLNILIYWGILANIIFFGYLLVAFPWPLYPFHYYDNGTLILGVDSNPVSLDPVNSWDRTSKDIIDQVCEGLFAYDLSDASLPIMNMLAESYFWENSTTIQIKLREGVRFHDHTHFDAAAVKWNLDRLNFMINATGMLTSIKSIALTAPLYYFPGETIPIMNRTEIIGTYNITIYLNAEFGPFLDLLCHEACFMLSPASTPHNRFLELYEDLVGTGPFIYYSFTAGVGIRFSRWNYYWRTPAYCSNLIFAIILSSTTRNNAMLSHEIDYLAGAIASLIPTFDADSTITVKKYTDDTGIPGLSYTHLGFNNHLINQTWRKAISYAINYSYIIEKLQHRLATRANSPISFGFGEAYNDSTLAPDYDLAYARQVLKDATIAGTEGLVANNDTVGSIADAWKTMTFLTVNYSYNVDDAFGASLLPNLTQWLNQIGIDVVADGGSREDFECKILEDHDALGIYLATLEPNYHDPFNILNLLFDPTSALNSAQVNDSWVNAQLKLVLTTTDRSARNTIYRNIQHYFTTESYPHVFVYHPDVIEIHSADIAGVLYNIMGKFEAYTMYREQWV